MNRPRFLFSFYQNVLVMGRTKPGFYAVRRGRKAGVYLTWDECKANVDKFNGARYKKFPTEEDAWRFVNDTDGKPSTAPYEATKVQPQMTPNLTATVAAAVGLTKPQQPAQRMAPGGILSGCSADTSTTTQHCCCCHHRNNCCSNSNRQFHSSATDTNSATSSATSKTDTATSSSSSSSAGVNGNSSYASLQSRPYDYNETLAAHAKRDYKKRQPSASKSEAAVGKRQRVDDKSTSKNSKLFKREPWQGDKKENVEYVYAEDRVVVYTDGACSFNGQAGAKAGIGVYWGDNHPCNVSERLDGRPTNQRAEILAAAKAVEIAKRRGLSKIILHTDSMYTINCINKWMIKWKKNGWQTVNNKDVHNKDELVLLDQLCQDVDVKWVHVPGHQNVKGNEAADKLATSGVLLPIPSN